MVRNTRSAACALFLALAHPVFCGSAASGAVTDAAKGTGTVMQSLPCALHPPIGREPSTVDPAALAATDALPPRSGLWGSEWYDLDMPAEDAIRQFMDVFLTSNRSWLEAALKRMRIYRRVIEERIAGRMLPREILFLPLVESGYQPRALSPQGASGLWQLMRATAAPYGLRMDGWMDERRDFLKATDASLRELEINHRVFGDWAMALAAYNCGSGTLAAIAKGAGTADYWALRRRGLLPRETAGFVPQLLALARIGSHPGRYGFGWDWEVDAVWERMPISRSVDLRILAEKAGLSYELLRDGNAELAYPLTPPRSYGWQLKVPGGAGKAVETALADAAAPLMEFTLHLVKTGDTLSQIALDYGISVELLQEFNPGVRPLALQIGAALIVPLPKSPGRSAS
jgi:membrane-bound lytic murein transglycosylase D